MRFRQNASAILPPILSYLSLGTWIAANKDPSRQKAKKIKIFIKWCDPGQQGVFRSKWKNFSPGWECRHFDWSKNIDWQMLTKLDARWFPKEYKEYALESLFYNLGMSVRLELFCVDLAHLCKELSTI
jgi:hypothetical protein